MELTTYKIVVIVLVIICITLFGYILYLNGKIKNTKEELSNKYREIESLNQINEKERLAAKSQHEADEAVIKKLTAFAKINIANQYKENDRIIHKDSKSIKDVNEYGEAETPIQR